MTSYKDFIDESNEYALKVKQYARLQIDQKIWDSISNNDLDNWLSNFKTPGEILLSSILLEALICRSTAQTTSILTSAIECALPRAVYENPEDIFEGIDFLEAFTSREVKSDIRIVPVIRNEDPPTKSGPSIARMYKRQLGINEKYMIWPWLIESFIEKGVNKFVFIDDVLASGNQVAEFFTTNSIKKFKDTQFIYIPLLAHDDGTKKISEKFPNVKVSPVERIGAENSLFGNDRFSQIPDLEDLYMQVAEKHFNKKFFKGMAKGYENLALTFSYYHATPNATLPLYWYESDSFYPLVKR